MTRPILHPGLRKGFGGLEALLMVAILGMLFVFVLNGAPPLISSMRSFVLAQQIERYRAAVQQYYADYRALPGDDLAAPARWVRRESLFNSATVPVSFAGDGKIDGKLDDPSSALGEQYMAWADLRSAGLIEGDAALVGQSVRPETLANITYGFAEANLGLNQVLCLTRVPGSDAALLDKRLDDGVISSGKLRGTSQWDPVGANNQFENPDITPYDPEKTYIICLPYLP